jgi:hypothetical protein
MTATSKQAARLLGIAFFTQAVTSLIGGAVFFNPFVSDGNIAETMGKIATNTGGVYVGVLLQIVTALVIIVLGVSLHRAVKHINNTAADIALGFYIFEALLLAVSQIFVFGLAKLSLVYSASGGDALLSVGELLLSSKKFAGSIAIIPFGLGAIIFYYLLLKAKIIPKWLALWSFITVPFVLIGVPLAGFGVPITFALFVPYVPWEFFTGAFIIIKSLRK